jgi:hypothetical protein
VATTCLKVVYYNRPLKSKIKCRGNLKDKIRTERGTNKEKRGGGAQCSKKWMKQKKKSMLINLIEMGELRNNNKENRTKLKVLIRKEKRKTKT